MADSHLVEETPLPSMPSASSSTPLHLSGFLNGDTIQVEGDTGSLQFSMQFNIHRKDVSRKHFKFPNANSFENNHTTENTSSFSSYMTPNSNFHEMEVEDRNAQADAATVENNEILETGECNTRNVVGILTRLRSGTISPVKYFPRVSATSCQKLKRIKKKKDLLETLLRRHSLPVRPCSSYSFFVMANWGSVKNSSFSEVSKTLGQMWGQLSGQEKKVFMDMASKDSARYKRQCTLLKHYARKRTGRNRRV
ncbi:hypothetical protein JCGZ_26329 [Jatropha curcas]|uniref:HMG box domain-containing protein n=1 Tax=Jatropha curcas TaxID=180498 RepID=A0A067JI50_JATCU|nr:hypothetical protein JCGZ_26329 [Jatropha curcas]